MADLGGLELLVQPQRRDAGRERDRIEADVDQHPADDLGRGRHPLDPDDVGDVVGADLSVDPGLERVEVGGQRAVAQVGVGRGRRRGRGHRGVIIGCRRRPDKRTAATYGVLISLNGALIVFCELPLTTLTRRFATRNVMAVGYVIIAFGFALNYFAHSLVALTACMILFTLGEMVTMPMASAYIANLAPANLRGRYLGVSGLTWSVALIFGPGLGMQLLAFSPAIYFAACGGLGLLAAGIILLPVKPAAAENFISPKK